MNDRKREILYALERMDSHGDANPQLATEMPYTVGLFAANKTNITRLHEAGVTSDESGSAGESRTRSKVARSRLIHSNLRRVARAAKRIEKKNPNFQNAFEMESGTLSYQQLTDKANGFLANRAANTKDFQDYGLGDDFFAELAADVAELGDVTEGQSDAKRTGVGATADTEAILEDALDVRAELKTALENHYRNDPVKLAELLTASHIERTARKSKDAAPPAGEEK